MVDREFVEEEFEKAERALGDARQLVDGSGSDEGAISRCYYAAFHAAQAVLYARDVNPSTHGAVRNLFGREVVLEGDATREHGRLLTTLGDLRERADYGYEPLDVDVDDLLQRTSEFVDDMAELVDST